MLPKRRLGLALVAAGLCIVAGSPTVSKTYPSRPVTIVAPFVPGGANDLLARLVAHRFERVLDPNGSRLDGPKPDQIPVAMEFLGRRDYPSFTKAIGDEGIRVGAPGGHLSLVSPGPVMVYRRGDKLRTNDTETPPEHGRG
jgi:hypothetical protein